MSHEPMAALPFIDEARIGEVLQWEPLIDAMERAMVSFSAGEVAQPVRQLIPVPGRAAFFAAMPAIGDAMAVKVVAFYPSNAGTEHPTHQAVILVFDKETGTPLAVLDGRLITEMRTAAGSAAAARALAPGDAKVLAILGNGVQAEAHAAALPRVRAFDELRLWGRNEARARACAEKLGARRVGSAEEAVRGADVVICATAATEPVLDGAWLKPGAFVSAVGWNTKDGRELDDDAMANTVIVESREAALDQAGNVRGSGCEIFAEIGEIYAGA